LFHLLHLFLLADILRMESLAVQSHAPGGAMSESARKVVATPASQSPKAPETAEKPSTSRQVEILIDGVRVEVSTKLEGAVLRAYQASLRPLPAEMTTTQAADFLDVSRPFIIKLIKRGELPCRMVGKHRRIPTDALKEYREKMFQRAKEAINEMTRLSQEMGLYDLEGPPPKAP
jgi:excisionase family DNA binding protein